MPRAGPLLPPVPEVTAFVEGGVAVVPVPCLLGLLDEESD